MGMVELTRLTACRGDVVMTIAFMVQFGVSLKKVTNGNKSLQIGILIKQGRTDLYMDILTS